MYSLEFSSKKIVLAFNKDYFCLKCFFNSEKLQNLDIAVKLRYFTVDLLLIYNGTFGRLF